MAAKDDLALRWAPFRTLDPTRRRARTPHEITALLLDPQTELGTALCDGLAQIVEAIGTAFPDNLFWDLDYVGACLLRSAQSATLDPDDRVEQIVARAQQLTRLQALFGRRTMIGFRYVHDFLYGFDWARWVAANPGVRADIGPFSDRFTRRMLVRGEQLVRTIAAGEDSVYRPIPAGRGRNPFPFRRDSLAECQLMCALAKSDGIPVVAWSIDAQPRWGFAFARRRAALATTLGLSW